MEYQGIKKSEALAAVKQNGNALQYVLKKKLFKSIAIKLSITIK